MGATSSRQDFPSMSSFSDGYESRGSLGYFSGGGSAPNSASLPVAGGGLTGSENVDDKDEGLDSDTLVPTTFTWNLGGQEVFVTGAWDQWQTKQPLYRMGNEHTSVLLLQVGKFQYKYIVDGEWRQHSNQPTEQDEHGNLNNVVEVVEQQSAFDPNEPPAPVEPLSPVESYDYAIPNTEELRVSDVPELPAYYLNPILNKEDIIGGKLAVPSHVCVGHLHTATRHFEGEKVTVLGITQRWRGKFITTVIYTPRGEAD